MHTDFLNKSNFKKPGTPDLKINNIVAKLASYQCPTYVAMLLEAKPYLAPLIEINSEMYLLALYTPPLFGCKPFT